MERGPLRFVRIIKKLLEWKGAVLVWKPEIKGRRNS
jgi:hypothetical protein